MESDTALHKKHMEKKKKERLLDFLRAAPSRPPWFTAAFVMTRLASLGGTRGKASGFRPALARSVDWRALRAKCLAWAKHPMNAALLVWLAFAAAGVAFVFLLMTGALNSAVPDAARRRRWTEVANQMLNALFTIMCVYQHPKLCHHLALLLRWRAADVAELRALYCKNGAAGLQRERLHVAVVVLLLHATCFAQYAYCALFWFFRTDTRPDWAVNLCMALGLGAPFVAGLYIIYGPLGRKIVLIPASSDEEAAVVPVEEVNTTVQCDNNNTGVVVAKPEWAGGLFDLGDDPTVAALSLSCTLCVFGWNMERLGLGNMYVHVFTFAFLCAAPVLVFTVAALNIHDASLGFVVGAMGTLLSVLGLMYGGFWRVQMRRRYGLPADRWSLCGGRAAVAADYGKWLCCPACALAQEVRTANLYDVEDEMSSEPAAAMAPLEREACVVAVDAPPLPITIQEKDCVIVELRPPPSSSL
ncbi:hypothetical protein GUJ93_ZPchr0011g27418 [Zizania palustris]|uniref:Uncharacterized protein n=1 Tax=Zizania palustris TaxID=103762 RepID=A0A8J5WJ73_ZIZPA|nr:hypothetical protein GUJ93_ZPchr0011g27418 [Zizania palustris]